jgi:hypothetical protein
MTTPPIPDEVTPPSPHQPHPRRNYPRVRTMHFVGFKDDRWHNAVKTFGMPDFVHRHWDYRAVAEVCPGDMVVFATGDETATPTVYAYDDSAFF